MFGAYNAIMKTQGSETVAKQETETFAVYEHPLYGPQNQPCRFLGTVTVPVGQPESPKLDSAKIAKAEADCAEIARLCGW